MNEGKRVPLNMRTTQELRDRMEEAAKASGRSLAQEVEFRLQASFDQPTMIDALADRLRAKLEERCPCPEWCDENGCRQASQFTKCATRAKSVRFGIELPVDEFFQGIREKG